MCARKASPIRRRPETYRFGMICVFTDRYAPMTCRFAGEERESKLFKLGYPLEVLDRHADVCLAV